MKDIIICIFIVTIFSILFSLLSRKIFVEKFKNRTGDNVKFILGVDENNDLVEINPSLLSATQKNELQKLNDEYTLLSNAYQNLVGVYYDDIDKKKKNKKNPEFKGELKINSTLLNGNNLEIMKTVDNKESTINFNKKNYLGVDSTGNAFNGVQGKSGWKK